MCSSCSPSPLGSENSKHLTWGKIVQMLQEPGQHTHTPLNNSESKRRNSDISTSEDPFEEILCSEVVDSISVALSDAKVDVLECSRLLVPAQLLEHVKQELLHLAAREPCGLRGAFIDLCLENGNSCQRVGQFAVAPSVVPTFQLTLILRPDLGGLWPKFRRRFGNSARLSTGFRVIKKKLYSSGELHIEEFI